MKLFICILFLYFFSEWPVFAQDSIVHLQEIKVQANRLESFGTGSKVLKLDSSLLTQYKNGSLADLLSQNNLLFIKSYSPGNLATPAFRGTGASHTAVLWNGFNIQSPMNGQTDFALLPANFVNNVQVQFGGAGALFGSGAIGGTIHLNNLPKFNKGVSAGVNASFGSFNNFQQNISIEISKKRWITGIKVLNTDNKNDYTFSNPSNTNEIKRQVNAYIKQQGFLFENNFQINCTQKINLNYWYQNANRQIPPTLLAGTNTKSFQEDQTHRLTSEWQKNGEKINWTARTAFFSEQIRFTQPNTDTSTNTAFSLINEVENTVALAKNQSLKLGFNNTHNWAQGNNLPSNPVLNRTALFAAYKISVFEEKWVATFSIREQFNETKPTPVTPSLGIAGNIYKSQLRFTGNISRNYRLPTFNDLNWKQGLTQGNPDLQPESGWSQDIGLLFSSSNGKTTSKISFEIAGNVFNSNIKNWIYWHDNVNGVLSVDNILSVWSRGFEFSGKFGWQIGKVSIFTDANFDYTLSTIQDADSKNVASIGKQLIYIPYNKAFINSGFAWKGFRFSYNHAFTGFRYSSEDNSSFLSAYSIGNIYSSYQMNMMKCQWQLFGRANNIWNANYQVLASRPMPLMNFQIGVSVLFNKANSI